MKKLNLTLLLLFLSIITTSIFCATPLLQAKIFETNIIKLDCSGFSVTGSGATEMSAGLSPNNWISATGNQWTSTFCYPANITSVPHIKQSVQFGSVSGSASATTPSLDLSAVTGKSTKVRIVLTAGSNKSGSLTVKLDGTTIGIINSSTSAPGSTSFGAFYYSFEYDITSIGTTSSSLTFQHSNGDGAGYIYVNEITVYREPISLLKLNCQLFSANSSSVISSAAYPNNWTASLGSNPATTAYCYAQNAVNTLYGSGVKVGSATAANTGSFTTNNFDITSSQTYKNKFYVELLVTSTSTVGKLDMKVDAGSSIWTFNPPTDNGSGGAVAVNTWIPYEGEITGGSSTSNITFYQTRSSGTGSIYIRNLRIYREYPGAPTGVTATGGNAQASIAFTPPTISGGSSIISYTVTSNPEGKTASGAVSPITVTGLTNGTTYTFNVVATNSGGSSASSIASGPITPDATANIINVSTPTSISTLTTTPVSDIFVSNAATLIVNTPTIVNSVTVNSNSKLDLSSNLLSVSALILKADKTTAPNVNVTNGMTVSGTVKLLKTLDSTKWYFMSFPSDVSVDAITQVSGSGTLGAIGTNWWIKYYDGAGRAVNLGTQSNWKQKNSGETLNANQGYIIGLSNSLTGDYVLSFPLNKSVVTSAENAKTVTVTAYGEGTSTPANSVGWNLVGIPYLSKFAGSGVGAAYLTFYNGSTYTQSTNTGVSSINPFDAFFIQASTTGTNPTTTNLAFTLESRQLVRNIVDNDASELVQINITNSSGADNTNLIMDDTQSTEYEINRDLEKWLTIGTNTPQIYTQLGGINYAFNALPINNVVNLPIGLYTKTAGLTTISANSSQAPSLSGLLLTDNLTGITTDLFLSDYSFTSVAGTDNSRFVLSAKRISTLNNTGSDNREPQFTIHNSQLTITNLLEKSSVRIFDNLGRMVANMSSNSDRIEMQLIAKGIYTIQIESGVKNWIKNFINQ